METDLKKIKQLGKKKDRENWEFRSFPHLDKEEFVTRLWAVVDNYSICPIVFNVYEILKDKLWQHNDVDLYDDFNYI